MESIIGQYGRALLTIPASAIELECRNQIQKFADHPAFTGQMVIMPDTHAGKGAVVGFTMPMGEWIVPNVIGVDVGCNVLTQDIGPDLSIDFADIDRFVRSHVPFGFAAHQRPALDMARDFPWQLANEQAAYFAGRYAEAFGVGITPPHYDSEWFRSKCQMLGADEARVVNSLGTLGGGNHFIEIGRARSNNHLWVTVHSGSRNFGKLVADYWQRLAASQTGALGSDLAWLEGTDAAGYLFDMVFAQAYARTNTRTIANVLRGALSADCLDEVSSVHNYVDFGDLVIRKGAIRSHVGMRMVIPFNMRDGILLCEGKSNEKWNWSAPHGAGRVMSRGEAKRKLDVATFVMQMDGIFSTSVGADTIDEAPDAYKDPAFIEEAIAPTAKIIDRVIPIHNLKDKTAQRRRRPK